MNTVQIKDCINALLERDKECFINKLCKVIEKKEGLLGYLYNKDKTFTKEFLEEGAKRHFSQYGYKILKYKEFTLDFDYSCNPVTNCKVDMEVYVKSLNIPYDYAFKPSEAYSIPVIKEINLNFTLNG